MNAINKVPGDWTSKSQKKTHRRYWTTTIEQMLQKLIQAEDRVVCAQKDTLRAIFAKFDAKRGLWERAVSCIALLDALLALAAVSSLPGYTWPQILAKQDEEDAVPVLRIVSGRHPMLEHCLAQRGDGHFIPNDLVLGGSAERSDQVSGSYREFNPRLLLLTGPNMGGKHI
jgi:DNA mismatch repair protein MSH6